LWRMAQTISADELKKLLESVPHQQYHTPRTVPCRLGNTIFDSRSVQRCPSIVSSRIRGANSACHPIISKL